MNSTWIFIYGYLSLIWLLSESFAAGQYENRTDYPNGQFSIDANPYSETKLLVPSASDNIENRDYRDTYSNYNDKKMTETNKHMVKTHIRVQDLTAEGEQNHQKKGLNDLEKKEEKLNDQDKKQNWQIPPTSPLSTADPKETNSSKRQIEPTGGGFIKQFIPSQELGPIGEGGFLPQYYPPQPSPTTYVLNKPEYAENSEEYRINLLAQQGMTSFQSDFGNLRSKYPELDELMGEYPVLEEVMKKKLIDRFRHTTKTKYYLVGNSEENSGEKLEAHIYRPNEESIRLPSTESTEKYIHPYTFEFPKPIRGLDLDLSTTIETPFAGELYQAQKLPLTYGHQFTDDKKNFTFDYKYPVHFDAKPLKPTSPWKRAVHMLTGILPLGLLLSALTPNIVTINNTADKSYPIRQRSLPEEASKMTNPLVEFINTQQEKSDRNFGGDLGCDDRIFCEVSKRGQLPDANTMEKALWSLANSTPESIAEKAGMKKLFKTVKSGKCEEFVCKKIPKANTERRESQLNINKESNNNQLAPLKKRRKSRVIV